jgi:Guanylate-binding protein, N-terminal domain
VSVNHSASLSAAWAAVAGCCRLFVACSIQYAIQEYFRDIKVATSRAITPNDAASMATFPDGAPGPLQLISYDDAGRVSVCESAMACLRAIKTPVGVIAVCGRARTGKSYLLNQLLGQATGFQLAHSHRPCTKGLWIWSQPVRRVGPDGNEYHLV